MIPMERGDVLVRSLLRAYAKNLMGTKLLSVVLVLILLGADSGAALICAAACMSSAPVAGALVHHHEMESQPTATHASQHTHHHGALCVECPPEAESSLNQRSDCTSLSEIQALREASFSLNAPTGVGRVLVNRPADGLPLACIIHEGLSGSRCIVKTGS
jgi:hypothetical protein